MDNIKNATLVDAVNEIIDDPNEFLSDELEEKLVNALKNSKLICPVDGEGNFGMFELNQSVFIPASCDMEDFRHIFKDETPKAVEFKDFSKILKWNHDGIFLNPGSDGFILTKRQCAMIFYRIKDEDKQISKGYDVKVRLNDFRPLTWRDIIIPENITFDELDDILKTLWGFYGHHLSAFIIPKDDQMVINREIAQESMMGCDFDSSTTLIDDIFAKYKKITYWYDFGDDWKFDIEIKKKIDYDNPYVTIKRFKGKYNPIEDCGGPWGLSDIIHCAENPDDADPFLTDMVDYLEEFDMEYAQNRLKRKFYVLSTWR